MKFNRDDFNLWLGYQIRAFGCLFIWEVSGLTVVTITGWLGYAAFIVITEVFYQLVKWIFLTKGKT